MSAVVEAYEVDARVKEPFVKLRFVPDIPVVEAYVRVADAAVIAFVMYASPCTVRVRDGVEEPIPRLPDI